MDVVGDGFLASHLREHFGDRYPRVTAAAAGVTRTTSATPAEFDREAKLVYGLLRRCRVEKRMLVFFSTASFAMYGTGDEPALETGPLYPPAAYGRHKLALEACVRASGVDHLILRLSHVVGRHRQRHQLLPSLVDQVLGGTVTVYRGARRDLLDAGDFCYVLDRLLGDGHRDLVLNVASGVPQPIEQVVDGVERRLGTRAKRLRMPGHAWHTHPSIDRLCALLPEFRRERVGPDYLDRVLDAHLPHLVSLVQRTPSVPGAEAAGGS
jgi:nucleoside-diphosphate-sugar epimerase